VYRTLYEYAACENDYFRAHFIRKRPRLGAAFEQLSNDLDAMASDLTAAANLRHVLAADPQPAQPQRRAGLFSPSPRKLVQPAPSAAVGAVTHTEHCEPFHQAEAVMRQLAFFARARTETIALMRRLSEMARPDWSQVAERMQSLFETIGLSVTSTVLSTVKRHIQCAFSLLLENSNVFPGLGTAGRSCLPSTGWRSPRSSSRKCGTSRPSCR
jgi:hypothetical protein